MFQPELFLSFIKDNTVLYLFLAFSSRYIDNFDTDKVDHSQTNRTFLYQLENIQRKPRHDLCAQSMKKTEGNKSCLIAVCSKQKCFLVCQSITQDFHLLYRFFFSLVFPLLTLSKLETSQLSSLCHIFHFQLSHALSSTSEIIPQLDHSLLTLSSASDFLWYELF